MKRPMGIYRFKENSNVIIKSFDQRKYMELDAYIFQRAFMNEPIKIM